MTILNDREIRARCLTPTHTWDMGIGPLAFYCQIGKNIYELRTGKRYFESLFKGAGGTVKEVTEEQLSQFRKPMISPFEPDQIRVDLTDGRKIISYGTSSMGYDVRLSNKFKIFTNLFNALIDPLDMPETSYVDHEGDYVIIPPNSYALGHTIEYFNIPPDITAICIGKSTYARAGCSVNITPIEAGFSGQVVIEIANQTPLPMKVYANMGIAQFLFLQGNECEVSYADRNGKYQGQTGIQTALV